MPAPKSTTKPEWICTYNEDVHRGKVRLAAFVAATEAERVPDEHGPFLPTLLPEYDPNCLTMIARDQKTDWDETHPKA
eukprot:12928126-Ditylum_brightwellii.AAC.1